MIKSHRWNKDKALYRAIEELNTLSRASWNAPIIPLDEPFQRGWERTYKLRDDASRRSDAPYMAYALKLVNTTMISRKLDKWPMNSNGTEMVQGLRVIPTKKIDDMKLDRRVLKWMSRGWFSSTLNDYYHNEYFPSYRNTVHGYTFSYAFRHYLVYDFSPHMITHKKVIMPEVERRIAELKEEIEKYGGWNRHSHLKGYRIRWNDIKETRRQRIEGKINLNTVETIE